ncbi:DUF885 family protein [Gemmatimonas phototrophica]|uniref:DUF885 domain-containing protein n=1 Tax=Gemmatimonas phototrophica TaxID=1379270 RepID=A0A143BIC5_9BACT|nr:DUF885 family protein [Gemmatimonas phototrophica]AMW04807.1 hypothetical protein GEMMAAP_08100 [Gemmatimonas phototrophica]
MRSPIDQFLEQYFFRHPVNATFTGMRLHDHELPDWTREARDDEQDEFEAITIALDDTFPQTEDWGTLAVDAIYLDAELARASLDVRQLEFESKFFHDKNPALWTGEALFGVIGLMLRPPTPVEDAFASIAMRLHDMPRFLGDLPDAITEPMPPRWVERAVKECVVGAELLRHKLGMWLDAHGADDASRLWVLEAGEIGAAALDATAQWLRAQPLDDTASTAIGAEAYEILLRRGHFCDDDAASLLRRAQEDMPEAQQRFESMAIEIAGSVEALAEALADDHPDTSGYLAAYADKWDACREFATDHDLVEWGTWPLRYTPIPAWAADAAPQLYFLFYRSPAPYEPRDEHLYLVTPVDASLPAAEQERRLRQWNHSAITLNHVVHHGALGHHVQNWHAATHSTSKIGTVAAVDCASRIGLFQGGSMAEGWACYATELADELGFLTPLEQASEQQSRVRMLARAIVDISLHTGVMSFDDAVEYYEAEVGMAHAAALGETTKNSMFPGTAVMYWLGTQGILALREAVRAREGSAFSYRRFHDALLSRGAIPVLLAAKLLLAE